MTGLLRGQPQRLLRVLVRLLVIGMSLLPAPAVMTAALLGEVRCPRGP